MRDWTTTLQAIKLWQTIFPRTGHRSIMMGMTVRTLSLNLGTEFSFFDLIFFPTYHSFVLIFRLFRKQHTHENIFFRILFIDPIFDFA